MVSDLARFRWHTGARLRRIDVDEKIPPLVRDVGPVALARFLRGSLHRLAGPRTPLLYLRTPGWREPCVDHAATGRCSSSIPTAWTSGARAQTASTSPTPINVITSSSFSSCRRQAGR
jgi:hypothetical protein